MSYTTGPRRRPEDEEEEISEPGSNKETRFLGRQLKAHADVQAKEERRLCLWQQPQTDQGQTLQNNKCEIKT